MKILLALLMMAPSAAYGAGPFIILATDRAYSDSGVVSVVQKYFSGQDYLGRSAITDRPELKGIVPPSHAVVLSTSVAGVDQQAQGGCGEQGAGVVFYQSGDEGGLLGNISQAAARVHAGGCQKFGLLPESQVFTVTNCTVNLDASIYQQVDWSAIDYIDIGGWQLLTDGCSGKSSMNDYVAFVKSMTSYIREKNPRILVDAHLSFGGIQPATMAQAIGAVSGIVDGFLLAYPLAPLHERKYCNAPNLAAVLSTFRRAGGL